MNPAPWSRPHTCHDARSLYDKERENAFAFARRGDEEAALRTLAAGCTGEWPFASAYAFDVARIRLLAGYPDGALIALWLEIPNVPYLRKDERRLIADCVAAHTSLWRLALSVVARSPAPFTQRVLAAASVLRAASA